MFTNIPTNDTRKQTFTQSTSASNASVIADSNAKKQSMIDHYERILSNWVNASNTNLQMSTLPSISFPVVPDIGQQVYDNWASIFKAKGYTVTNDGRIFTVSQ